MCVCVCVFLPVPVCVCVFVCSCLEDMHKNALHFRFSLMRVCWWALFSALVFRKQWFPICPPPHQLFYPNPPLPSKHFPIRTPNLPFSLIPFTLLGRQKWNCSEFILCFEQSFVAYFKAVLPAAVMYVLWGGGGKKKNQNNQNKNNQLRFVVEKLQNYAKVRRPPTIQTPPNFIRLWKAYFPCLAGVCQSFSQPRWTDR